MMAGITWTGDEAFEAWLKRAPDKAALAFAGALDLEAKVIMTRSVDVFVPVDVGTLANSNTVEKPVVKRMKASVTMGYGGAAADYALIQHENRNLHHPRQGGPKYLERPVLEARRGFGQRLARRVRRRMEAL